MINARARDAGEGRWDFLDGLTEIDASHWNKILKGKAVLSENKFLMLKRRLCETEEESLVLDRLFALSAKQPLDRAANGVLTRKRARSELDAMLAKLSISQSDLSDLSAIDKLVNQSIVLQRLHGNNLNALESAQVLIYALRRGLIKLHPESAEVYLVEVFSSYSYIAYSTGDCELFLRILSELKDPFYKKWDKGALTATILHLERRLSEDFLSFEKSIAYSKQASAIAALRPAMLDDDRYAFIRANLERLSIENGLYLAKSRSFVQDRLLLAYESTSKLEHMAFSKAFYSKWLLQHNLLDEANQVLSDTMSILDRRFGVAGWARQAVRHHQALCALKEYRLTGQIDFARTAIGYLNSAIGICKDIGNQMQENKLRHQRLSIFAEAGLDPSAALWEEY